MNYILIVMAAAMLTLVGCSGDSKGHTTTGGGSISVIECGENAKCDFSEDNDTDNSVKSEHVEADE